MDKLEQYRQAGRDMLNIILKIQRMAEEISHARAWADEIEEDMQAQKLSVANVRELQDGLDRAIDGTDALIAYIEEPLPRLSDPTARGAGPHT